MARAVFPRLPAVPVAPDPGLPLIPGVKREPFGQIPETIKRGMEIADSPLIIALRDALFSPSQERGDRTESIRQVARARAGVGDTSEPGVVATTEPQPTPLDIAADEIEKAVQAASNRRDELVRRREQVLAGQLRTEEALQQRFRGAAAQLQQGLISQPQFDQLQRSLEQQRKQFRSESEKQLKELDQGFRSLEQELPATISQLLKRSRIRVSEDVPPGEGGGTPGAFTPEGMPTGESPFTLAMPPREGPMGPTEVGVVPAEVQPAAAPVVPSRVAPGRLPSPTATGVPPGPPASGLAPPAGVAPGVPLSPVPVPPTRPGVGPAVGPQPTPRTGPPQLGPPGGGLPSQQQLGPVATAGTLQGPMIAGTGAVPGVTPEEAEEQDAVTRADQIDALKREAVRPEDIPEGETPKQQKDRLEREAQKQVTIAGEIFERTLERLTPDESFDQLGFRTEADAATGIVPPTVGFPERLNSQVEALAAAPFASTFQERRAILEAVKNDPRHLIGATTSDILTGAATRRALTAAAQQMLPAKQILERQMALAGNQIQRQKLRFRQLKEAFAVADRRHDQFIRAGQNLRAAETARAKNVRIFKMLGEMRARTLAMPGSKRIKSNLRKKLKLREQEHLRIIGRSESSRRAAIDAAAKATELRVQLDNRDFKSSIRRARQLAKSETVEGLKERVDSLEESVKQQFPDFKGTNKGLSALKRAATIKNFVEGKRRALRKRLELAEAQDKRAEEQAAEDERSKRKSEAKILEMNDAIGDPARAGELLREDQED